MNQFNNRRAVLWISEHYRSQYIYNFDSIGAKLRVYLYGRREKAFAGMGLKTRTRFLKFSHRYFIVFTWTKFYPSQAWVKRDLGEDGTFFLCKHFVPGQYQLKIDSKYYSTKYQK